MKQLFVVFLLGVGLFLVGCTKLTRHPHHQGDNYCLYLVDSVINCKSGSCYKKGDTICIFCRESQKGLCGDRRIAKIEISPSGDTYSLEGIGVNPTCDRCPLKDTARLYEAK